MKQKKAWSFFQSLGKAFMYPIALLSVCGMMLGLGSGLASDDMAKLIPFLAIPIIKTILDFIVSLGLFAFVNLPVLFAIAIPLGLLKDKEDKAYGAFSGLIGFMAMHLGTNFYLKQHDYWSLLTKCRHMGKPSFWGSSPTIPACWGELLLGY